MIGLASVAPAYSLAATLGYVVIEDGTLAPVAVVRLHPDAAHCLRLP